MKSKFKLMYVLPLAVILVAAMVAMAQSPNGIRGWFTGDVYSQSPFHVYQATFNSITDCAGVGTAANPSVATCVSAPSGTFSCATAASAAANGCKVNTTAVTANSEIDIMQDSSLGTKLGVTCNTAVISMVVSARVAGTSFSVTPGTIATNPGCFSYTITN